MGSAETQASGTERQPKSSDGTVRLEEFSQKRQKGRSELLPSQSIFHLRLQVVQLVADVVPLPLEVITGMIARLKKENTACFEFN